MPASLLLHLLALEWANGNLGLPDMRSTPPDVVTTVELDSPELPPQPAASPAKPRKQAPKPKRTAESPAPAATVPDEPAVATASSESVTPSNGIAQPTDIADAVPQSASQSAPNSAAAAPSDANALPAVANNAASAADATPVHYKIDLPPPVELDYDVVKVSDTDSRYYGSGTISWQSAGGNYQINGRASVLFLPLLHFKSEGIVDEYGIAPVLYNQKNFNRAEINTHFNRDERNSISFSSSKLSIPRQGGEQDRASILWQLSGIGRGDRDKFFPGGQIDMFVAGERDGDLWRINVVGEEAIETGAGKMQAWHVVRVPRPGTYEDQIDIWLAPQYEWSPVKIHYTYKRGGYLDLSMSSFHSLRVADAH